MIVLRRTTPRHDGSRYYAKPAPVQGRVEHAHEFATEADAEAERATLREPCLWQVMTAEDAAGLDAQEHRAFMSQQRPTREEAHALMVYRALSLTAAGLALPPEMRR